MIPIKKKQAMINQQEYTKQSNTGSTTVFKRLSNNSYYKNSHCFLTVPVKTIQQNGIYLKAEIKVVQDSIQNFHGFIFIW